jgi:hypothetical protein
MIDWEMIAIVAICYSLAPLNVGFILWADIS